MFFFHVYYYEWYFKNLLKLYLKFAVKSKLRIDVTIQFIYVFPASQNDEICLGM